jgi:hypothetical protein
MSGFMQLQVWQATKERPETVEGAIHTRGWFARYSAPGYMDCTDNVGPYETRAEALRECFELFGDSESDAEWEEFKAMEVES